MIIYFLLPRLNVKVAMILLVLVFAVRMGYIYAAAKPFSNRIAILDTINNKMKEKDLAKVIIPEPVSGTDSALIVNWGAQVESIILSKLKGEAPQRSFVFADASFIASEGKVNKDIFLGCWQRWPSKEINSYYFRPDTSTAYVVMSFDDLMK